MNGTNVFARWIKRIARCFAAVCVIAGLIIGLIAAALLAHEVWILLCRCGAPAFAQQLADAPLPEDARLLSCTAVSGTLGGNGNNFSYLGVLFIEGKGSAEAYQAHYEKRNYQPPRLATSTAAMRVQALTPAQLEDFCRSFDHVPDIYARLTQTLAPDANWCAIFLHQCHSAYLIDDIVKTELKELPCTPAYKK